MTFWELAVAEGADADPVDMNLPFEIVSEVRDGAFEASVQGRMDTITAPELLKRFQDAGGDVKAIRLDVSRMSYISSAGLRVLVMMYKSQGGADGFKMTGVSEDVRKILETAGMDRLLLGR